MDVVGTWLIYEMEMWDEDYFDMEVQAYIEIDSNNRGDFQFGLVAGGLNGIIVDDVDVEGLKRFEFTWFRKNAPGNPKTNQVQQLS